MELAPTSSAAQMAHSQGVLASLAACQAPSSLDVPGLQQQLQLQLLSLRLSRRVSRPAGALRNQNLNQPRSQSLNQEQEENCALTAQEQEAEPPLGLQLGRMAMSQPASQSTQSSCVALGSHRAFCTASGTVRSATGHTDPSTAVLDTTRTAAAVSGESSHAPKHSSAFASCIPPILRKGRLA